MSLRRGTFRVLCDHPGCTEEVDLETNDFEEAKEAKDEHPDMDGWINVRKVTGWQDYCEAHNTL